MKTYELTYIISPEITSEEATSETKKIESLIQGKEGIILKQNNPVAKALAYPIKNRASGFLGVLEFQLEAEKLSELKETIEKDGKIVRHMVIIKKPIKPIKERKSRIKPVSALKTEDKIEKEEKSSAEIEHSKRPSPGKEKIELEDIDQQLDEILGQ